MALTDTKVRSAKPQEKEYSLVDGDGMFLLLHPNGSKYWRFRFRFGGKQHLMAFGVYPETSLADARQKREKARRLVAAGVDPREHKRAEKEEQVKEVITFESVARDWHASNQKWSESHSGRVLKSLEDNLFDAIGKRNIAELKTRDLLIPIKAVEMSGRLEVAARLQQRTTAIMRFAVQSGLIDYNPAQEIAGAVATAKRQHRAALELNRIPELLHRIDTYTGRPLTRLAVELTLLVFIRSSELRFARWSEVDFDTAMWTIPGEREPLEGVKHSHRGSKMRTPHLVPLSRQALTILEQIKSMSGNRELIFVGDHDPRKPMSENTVNKALRVMGYDTKVEVCGHGFRTMACSSLIESGLWSKDAVERQMSHQERNSVRAAYIHKAEHLGERRLMVQWWADYLDANREKGISPFDFAKVNK
ncbi:TPA: integrase arm-type DNA-binding domain-containing protein [Enterobacter hormaechei subsp. oharae]|uniref:tyrosine-type recombinase/integrase n=1 Tax=Enterobacter hormaechei TaxID=158836 RepID=UPI000793C03E|nr:integrase arm-type DNA-binding domain-containing protein [Enterobacter hormaechei]ELC6405102.1 integrase arm-type DNA-binding domain-containing protein [Enterobacter hormaechei]MCC9369191.1 integrase arm-type DNA-binding domain-containing protein [Enterobacter hormaechei subsp. oharae]MCC9409212.1 integrase arm-type DNA-binding domain-containing protein [Enterobacter hormaechei subsp. oharae]SAC07687.1 integrase [Enterobacter hormaechei]SAI24123.1 integrase [Enterobacter hormaechei]